MKTASGWWANSVGRLRCQTRSSLDRKVARFLRLDLAVAQPVHSSYLPIFNGVALALPGASHYARRRLRRIMPAYLVTVLLAYIVCSFYSAGPNPGQSWAGLLRYLTLTQIYTNNYLLTYLHQGLSQMWSLAVEVSFYAALPLLA